MRHRNRRIILFHKIVSDLSPTHLYDWLPIENLEIANGYMVRKLANRRLFKTGLNLFASLFFPGTPKDWTNLTLDTRNSSSSEHHGQSKTGY